LKEKVNFVTIKSTTRVKHPDQEAENGVGKNKKAALINAKKKRKFHSKGIKSPVPRV